MNCKIGWKKLDENAIIPTKTEAAAGFDIYTLEPYTLILPHEQHLFSTGLGVILDDDFWLMAFDRGSTGSKGLHIHCGVIDSDYRGEIFICIKNDNNYPVVFTDAVTNSYIEDNAAFEYRGDFYNKVLYYPVSKAIAQLIAVEKPQYDCYEVADEEWENSIECSLRKAGKLGSSGK